MYMTKSNIQWMLELISPKFNCNLFISQYYHSNLNLHDINYMITILQTKYEFNWKEVIMYLLNNNRLINTDILLYFYKKREEEIENYFQKID